MSTMQQQLLKDVQEGMTVYDHRGHKIGKVNLVYLGANAAFPGAIGLPAGVLDEALIPDAVRDTVPPDRVPEVIRRRLFRTGFLKLNTGLLTPDRFVLLNQVKAVLRNGIYLSVGKDETLKF